MTRTPPTVRQRTLPAVAVAVLAGALVSLSLGAYGHLHHPTGSAITTLGFPTVLTMKAWLTTAAATLAVLQLFSALWMYGRLPWTAPSWLAPLHRWAGTAAFLISLPVAYHCLWSLGFHDQTARTLNHSLLGCVFYGVFTTKMFLLRVRRSSSWLVPIAGGLLFTVLIGLWLTSALWYFRHLA
ncbi:hypothetical protein D1871_14345 [Nakamurella silvestris]|nr:hypothetical protein D1871_14345 [Nakamurella silvestris]